MHSILISFIEISARVEKKALASFQKDHLMDKSGGTFIVPVLFNGVE